MFFRKANAYLLALILPIMLLFSMPAEAAAEGKPARYIAVVYDDSGSMRYVYKWDKLKNYVYANYSLQNLAALMDDRDSAKVFLMSEKGADPIDVKKQQDLYGLLKDVGIAKGDGDTFADTIDAALKSGAAFLQANPGGEFLFILITDGETMYDARDRKITGPLQSVFQGYVRNSGIDKLSGRTKALLLSIGRDKLLAPVGDMASVLEGNGIATQTFQADVSDEGAAGERIMAAMADLAQAMAGTKGIVIEPGKPFTISEPLENLVIMEQYQQGGASMIKSIKDDRGNALSLQPLYTTKAIGGLKLASTYTSATSAAGGIEPGTYTLESSGKVRLTAFPMAAAVAAPSPAPSAEPAQTPEPSPSPAATAAAPATNLSTPAAQPTAPVLSSVPAPTPPSLAIRLDWRYWPEYAAVAAALLLVAVYIALIARKRRIPLDLAISVSPNGDMAFATGVKLERNMIKRNFWPFGRETCALGLMELYPHPRSNRHLILSSVCVQYGLRIDGRLPQNHKAKDKFGDFVIGENNVIGVREDGRYRYYRISFTGVARVSRLGYSRSKSRS